MHIGGTILYIFSISGFSFYILILGISIYLFGKEINSIIAFPLLYLVFMFPLPIALLNEISLPMKMIVAKISSEIVSFFGISIYREGFNITIPEGTILVGNPCSGLRSLISFLAIGSVFAYYHSSSNIKKLTVFLMSIPIALASNIIRVLMLILIAHYKGIEYSMPESFWHDASGIIVFVIGLVIFLVTGKSLSEDPKKIN
jgi:exosortase